MLAPAIALSALAALSLGAAPALELVPPAVRPGDALLLRVSGATAAPRGAIAGRGLSFWRAGDEWWALAALPVETPPGATPVRLSAGRDALSAELTVLEPGFTRHNLTLDRKFVEPPRSVKQRIADDRKAFARAFTKDFGAPLFQAAFAWPREAHTTGHYGDQRLLNGKVSSVHYGLDLDGARGAPILAANDGEVVLTRDAYYSGNSVVLWHGGGIYTVYFHMDRVAVHEGQTVARGDRLGDVGATGRATGPHLHWGVKVNGLYVDPESLLAIDFATGTATARRPGAAPQESPTPSPPEPQPASVQPAQAP